MYYAVASYVKRNGRRRERPRVFPRTVCLHPDTAWELLIKHYPETVGARTSPAPKATLIRRAEIHAGAVVVPVAIVTLHDADGKPFERGGPDLPKLTDVPAEYTSEGLARLEASYHGKYPDAFAIGDRIAEAAQAVGDAEKLEKKSS